MSKQRRKVRAAKTKPKKDKKLMVFLGAIFIMLTVIGIILHYHGNNVVLKGVKKKRKYFQHIEVH